MTTLSIMALLVLLFVFAVCFLLFKAIWLICKKHTNRGPLIAAGICTALFATVVVIGSYTAYKKVMAPFTDIMARVKQNPAPVYGPHTYTDDTYPFEMTVYDGMDFSKWIHIGEVQLKLGIDTNVFKKDAAGKQTTDFLLGAIARQSTTQPEQSFQELQKQLFAAQAQRRLEIKTAQETVINGHTAYVAQGEAYSNRGKIDFDLTAIQAENTVYYLLWLSTSPNPEILQVAQQMANSFVILPTGK